MGALRAPLCLPGWEPAAPGSCSWLQLPQYSPSTPKEWQNFWFSSFWQPYTPSCSGCWPHPTPSGNKEWRYFIWTELQIQSWVLAVKCGSARCHLPEALPCPRCISPFKNQKRGRISGLAPSQAGNCPRKGRSTWTVTMEREREWCEWPGAVLCCTAGYS